MRSSFRNFKNGAKNFYGWKNRIIIYSLVKNNVDWWYSDYFPSPILYRASKKVYSLKNYIFKFLMRLTIFDMKVSVFSPCSIFFGNSSKQIIINSSKHCTQRKNWVIKLYWDKKKGRKWGSGMKFWALAPS